MAQNYKHIFIGLGGAGVNTVAFIKKKVYDKTKAAGSRSRLTVMNEKYRFLFFDTDQRDIDRHNRNNRDTFENGIVPFINPATDLISLAKGNPHAIYEEAKANDKPLINKRILEACSEDVAAKIPDQPLKFGAGAFRMKSRLSFARSLSEFQQKLQAAIEDLNSVKNTGGEENTIFYWVVCSTNGGTGSGIINDVLYYVNMQHKRSIGDGDPHLVLTMYMPKFYIDKNSTEEKYSLNAFAVFKEIEGIKAMSNDPKRNKVFHRLAFLKDYNLINSDERYDPFYYLIPIDCQTDNGTNIGDAMYPNTAEMLYYVHEGEGGMALHSDVDNYMHDLYNLRPKGFLVPMGYIALRKPEKEFEDYVNLRLEQDLLEYGLANDDMRGVQADEKPEEKAVAFYRDLFGDENVESSSELFQSLASIKSKVVSKAFAEFDDVESMDKSQLKGEGLGPEKINEAMKKFEVESMNDGKVIGFDEALNYTLFKMWDKAESLVAEFGLTYAVKFFEKVRSEARKAIVEFRDSSRNKGKNSEAKATRDEEIDKALKEVREFKLTESKNSQREDILEAVAVLKKYADKEIEAKIVEIKDSLLKSFCDAEGEGKINELVLHLKSMYTSVKELATEASDKYKRFAGTLAEKALDVTSVYLPEMKTICNSDGWIRGNRFSRMYESHVSVTNDNIEGKDKVPVRRGEKSLESILKDLYKVAQGGANDDSVTREINRDFAVAGLPEKDDEGNVTEGKPRIRFFANPDRVDNLKGIVERVLVFAKKRLQKEISQDAEIKQKWLDAGVHKFFEELDSENRERVRRSLNPTLFFNYKENRIAVDYREFLIFVAKDPDVAKDMLGYQEGNPKHRLITVKDEDNAAFVIRSKYGLSFSEYRLYDTMKELYEKAPNRDKYHFHHYYAEYGEDITLEDLPVEISDAHKTYVKLRLLDKFCAGGENSDLAGFFYESEYASRKADFASTIIMDNPDGTFSVARPSAIGEADGKICVKVVDKNSRLFASYEGDDFVQVFADYQKQFIKNSVQAAFDSFLTAVVRHFQKRDGVITTGNQIIANKFDEYRKEMLHELDDKIMDSRSEGEKTIYKALLYVLDSEIKNVHDFLTK